MPSHVVADCLLFAVAHEPLIGQISSGRQGREHLVQLQETTIERSVLRHVRERRHTWSDLAGSRWSCGRPEPRAGQFRLYDGA